MYSIFYFKQKTAYELRISDWSSDVCSSDLALILLEALEGLGAGKDVGRDLRLRRPRPRLDHLGQGLLLVGGIAFHHLDQVGDEEIGRASCRERVCQYV